MATSESRSRVWLVAAVAAAVIAVWALITATQPMEDSLGPLRQAFREHNLNNAATLLEATADAANSGERAFLQARYHRRLQEPAAFRRSLTLAANLGYPRDLLAREQVLMLTQQGQLGVNDQEVTDLLADPREDTLEIYLAVVLSCLTNMQKEEARLFLDGWQADYPSDPLPDYYQGLIHQNQREWAAAAERFRQSLSKGLPNAADAHQHLADVLRADHHYRAALDHYLAASDEDAAVPRGMAACYTALGQIEQAASTYADLLDRFPQDAAALSASGQLENKRGNHLEAISLLNRAVAANPSDMQAWHALGWSLVATGDESQARAAFQTAVRLSEQIQRSEYLRQRIDADPANTSLQLQLARLLQSAGRPEDARIWLGSVLQRDPENAEARKLLTNEPPASAAATDPARSAP